MSREALWAYYRDDDLPLYQHAADSELEVLMQEAPLGAGGRPGIHTVDGQDHSTGPGRPGSTARRSARRAALSTQPVRQDTDLGDTVFSILEEVLTERERWIVEAWVFERLGVRAIGEQLSLSKSQVHRILHAALKKLASQLSSTPVVAEWLASCALSQTPAVLSEESPCNQEESDETDHV